MGEGDRGGEEGEEAGRAATERRGNGMFVVEGRGDRRISGVQFWVGEAEWMHFLVEVSFEIGL